MDGKIRPGIAALRAGDTGACRGFGGGSGSAARDRQALCEERDAVVPVYGEVRALPAPPKVMWGVDDEIRALIKTAAQLASAGDQGTADKAEEALDKAAEMIFKEENIMLPMLLEVLTGEEWKHIADPERRDRLVPDTGTAGMEPEGGGRPPVPAAAQAGEVTLPDRLSLGAGGDGAAGYAAGGYHVRGEGRHGAVFLSGSGARVSAQPRPSSGARCRPATRRRACISWRALWRTSRAAKRRTRIFGSIWAGSWCTSAIMRCATAAGEYLGVLEVTQDIVPIQRISGEKRLVSKE